MSTADFAALFPLARRLGVSFENPTPPRDLTLTGAGGIRLHALDWGGAGELALFLHGGRLTARTWDYVCLGVRDRVRPVALDLRGHGDSDRADDYSIASNVGDVGAVLNALGARSAHIVGMSLGGAIAAHFAASASEQINSLVVVDVGPGVVFEGTARMRDFFAGIGKIESVEAVVDAAMQTSPESDRARVAYRMNAMLRRNPRGELSWAYDCRRKPDYSALLAEVADMDRAAKSLRAPCLVVRGGRSPVFSDQAAERFAASFARGQWTVVPDAGHNVQEDNPASLIAALDRFW
jgi:pimeloyl-ACP methyl ester carboxylesterase